MTISHDDLHTQLVTLQTRFDEHSRQSRENQAGMAGDLKEISQRLGAGSNMFTEVKGMVSEVRLVVGGIRDEQEKHGKRITALEVAGHVQQGERGVWAALAKSPVVMWLAGIAMAAWAFLSHVGEGAAK